MQAARSRCVRRNAGFTARHSRKTLPILVAALLLSALAGCQQGNGAAQAQPVATDASGNSPGAPAAANAAMGEDGSRAAGGNQDGSAGNFASGGGGDDGVQTVPIPDPTFGGMQSGTITAPAGWKVQTELAYHHCLMVEVPDLSLDAVSPDGGKEFNILPKFEWSWGWSAQYGHGCIPLNGVMSAADFLKTLAPKLPGQIQIVGDMPVSEAFRSRELKNVAMQTGMQRQALENARQYPPQFAQGIIAKTVYDNVTGDVAAARAIDGSGRELRLRVWTLCMQNAQMGNCIANVDVLRAPKGRLDALAGTLENPDMFKLALDDQWKAAYAERQQKNNQAMQAYVQRSGQITQQIVQQGGEMLRQQGQADQARLTKNHEVFMQQQQRSFDSSMANAQAQMNARSTAASDTEDYALDQQTVSGANGTYKTSSQYSNVWSSPQGGAPYDGRTYGTNDNTANPNTATDNTWTQDQKVHGNGQPYSSGHP